MALIETLFYTFIAFGVLVTFHEFGHFWVARRCNVRVEKFSIGFGKKLFSWRDKHNTEFVLAALPLGGYVKMLDEREGDIATEDRIYAFTQKTVLQRIAIISAGPLANFLLAIIVYWFLFLGGEKGLAPVIGDISELSLASQAGLQVGMEITAVGQVTTTTWGAVNRQLFDFIGTTGDIPLTVRYADSISQLQVLIPVDSWLRDADNPSPSRELGLQPPFEFEALVLGPILESGAGFRAGLLQGDILLAVNGEDITSADGFIEQVSASIDKVLFIDLERPAINTGNTETLTIEVMPERVLKNGEFVGQLGVQLAVKGNYPEQLIRHIDHDLLSALARGVEETVTTAGFILSSLGKLIVGDLSAKNLSGPITIAKMAGDTAKAGIDNFIRFIAILSIMLGVMNLLPIPVLDGGHLVYCVVEWIKGSPVSDQVQIIGYKIGFFLLISLMIFATFNDLMRPF
ncbi:MAG: RIP metalloprotease RseP [Porticoccaceae bacterium]|nr:RIP metalloprotease RseP [Porticoccaceae bacterium]